MSEFSLALNVLAGNNWKFEQDFFFFVSLGSIAADIIHFDDNPVLRNLSFRIVCSL